MLAAATLALAACAPRGTLPVAAAPERPRPEFAPLPKDKLASLHRAHDGGVDGKPLCQACHAPDGGLAGGGVETCRRCHAFGHNNHPVEVVQKIAAPGLPLLPGGRVACHTCHDPHAQAMKHGGLRKEFNALCLSCHAKH